MVISLIYLHEQLFKLKNVSNYLSYPGLFPFKEKLLALTLLHHLFWLSCCFLLPAAGGGGR